MAGYRYSISLRVWHPTIDLSVVGEELGLTPGVIHKVGEPRQTPKGRRLEGANQSSFWTASLLDADYPGQRLSSALEKALTAVRAASVLFAEINETGGRVEFFIGWFFDDGNSGDVLDHRLLGQIAAAGIDLSFDIYP